MARKEIFVAIGVDGRSPPRRLPRSPLAVPLPAGGRRDGTGARTRILQNEPNLA